MIAKSQNFHVKRVEIVKVLVFSQNCENFFWLSMDFFLIGLSMFI